MGKQTGNNKKEQGRKIIKYTYKYHGRRENMKVLEKSTGENNKKNRGSMKRYKRINGENEGANVVGKENERRRKRKVGI